MADYTALKQAVRQVVLPNGNEEITGSVLQGALVETIESLGKHFQYAGRATRTTNPGTPDEKVFYIAVDAGIYPHFDEIEVIAIDAMACYQRTQEHKEAIMQLESVEAVQVYDITTGYPARIVIPVNE